VPNQDEFGMEGVIDAAGAGEFPEGDVVAGGEVIDEAVGIEGDGAEEAGETKVGRLGEEPALDCLLEDDGFGAFVVDGIEEGIGDFGERFFPGDLLPLAFAPLTCAAKGVEQAVGRGELFAPCAALLAAHRVHIGDADFDGVVVPRGLFKDDSAVLRIDTVGAGRKTVQTVGTEGRGIPRPPPPVPFLRFVGGRGFLCH